MKLIGPWIVILGLFFNGACTPKNRNSNAESKSFSTSHKFVCSKQNLDKNEPSIILLERDTCQFISKLRITANSFKRMQSYSQTYPLDRAKIKRLVMSSEFDSPDYKGQSIEDIIGGLGYQLNLLSSDKRMELIQTRSLAQATGTPGSGANKYLAGLDDKWIGAKRDRFEQDFNGAYRAIKMRSTSDLAQYSSENKTIEGMGLGSSMIQQVIGNSQNFAELFGQMVSVQKTKLEKAQGNKEEVTKIETKIEDTIASGILAIETYVIFTSALIHLTEQAFPEAMFFGL